MKFQSERRDFSPCVSNKNGRHQVKKFFRNLLVIAVIIVAGVGIAMVGMTLRSRPSDAGIVAERKPQNVKVQILKTATVEDDLKLMGTFEPWLDIVLSAINMGVIGWQGIEEGDFVEGDQELIRIDTAELLVSLAQMKAQHKLATSELNRVRSMEKEGISSPQAHDRAMTDYEIANVNLRSAELKIADGLIQSKISGVVDTLHLEEGEYVKVGDPLIRLVQVDRLKLVVGIPERDVIYFSKGDTVSVTLDPYPDERFTGTIYLIAATAEISTHTFPTEIELDNSTGKLKPGMMAEARLVRREFPNSIMIPIFSMMTTDIGKHVFIDDNGEARHTKIDTGFLLGNKVYVRGGLESGDRLIVLGQRDLVDGDPLIVREVIE